MHKVPTLSPPEAARTFELAWSHATFPTDATPNTTLHRRVPSLGPDTSALPSIRVGVGEGQDLIEEAFLGEGGMGLVHAAHDPVLSRSVAIKRPKPDAGGRAASALLAEARTLAALDHPNVVPVHSLGCDADGAPILVMKRVTGRRWSDLLAEKADLDRDLQIVLEVADAVRYAHARGILHRDVKPDNVMVGEFGEVYLMDWGCACHLDDAVTNEIVGTPSFMAPEMLAVGSRIVPATDVFLLGATLHHALTGASRHAGQSIREVLANAWTSPPAEYDPNIPIELGQIVNRACAPRAEDRPASVEAFANELRTFLSHRSAIGMAQRAHALLAELERLLASGNPRADAVFAECRFGFRGALSTWPECREASAGLARACATYIPHKLESGEVGAAEALLAELAPMDAQRWRAKLAETRDLRSRMEQEFQGTDLALAARERRNASALLGVFATLSVLGVAFGKPPDQITPVDTVWLGISSIAFLALGMLPFRKRLFANRASRSIMFTFVIAWLGSLFNRVLGWLADTPVPETLRTDMVLFTTANVMVALTTDRNFAFGSLPFICAAACIVVWPALAAAIFPAAVIVGLGISIAIFQRTMRNNRDPSP